MSDSNPYKPPREETSAESSPVESRIPAFLWPRTKGGCIVLALLIWPVVAILTDVLGVFVGPYFAVEDFGLTVSNVTMPLTFLFAIVVWMRGFIIHERSRSSVALGIVTLPIWFISTGCMTFCIFPFGRINPNF